MRRTDEGVGVRRRWVWVKQRAHGVKNNGVDVLHECSDLQQARWVVSNWFSTGERSGDHGHIIRPLAASRSQGALRDSRRRKRKRTCPRGAAGGKITRTPFHPFAKIRHSRFDRINGQALLGVVLFVADELFAFARSSAARAAIEFESTFSRHCHRRGDVRRPHRSESASPRRSPTSRRWRKPCMTARWLTRSS